MEIISSHQSPILLNPSDWQGLLQMERYTEEQKLQLTSQEFESTLVRQYLKDALKPLFKGAIEESGVSSEIYRGYYTDVLAQSLSRGQGMGISSVLQCQLSTQHQSKESKRHE
jgi:Rod binding domain-containing protein